MVPPFQTGWRDRTRWGDGGRFNRPLPACLTPLELPPAASLCSADQRCTETRERRVRACRRGQADLAAAPRMRERRLVLFRASTRGLLTVRSARRMGRSSSLVLIAHVSGFSRVAGLDPFVRLLVGHAGLLPFVYLLLVSSLGGLTGSRSIVLAISASDPGGPPFERGRDPLVTSATLSRAKRGGRASIIEPGRSGRLAGICHRGRLHRVMNNILTDPATHVLSDLRREPA